MQKSTAPNSSFDENGPGPEDADSVQKTTYVVGKGTDDRARQRPAKREDEALTQPPQEPAPRRGTAADDAG